MVDTATSQATEQPGIPPHLQIGQNQSQIVYAEQIDTGLRCVLFVGDILRLEEKTTPALKLGGRVFEDSYCLPQRTLTRCAITPLQQGMMSVHAAFIDPKERKFYKSSFTKTNHWNPVTQRFESVVVGGNFDAKREDGSLIRDPGEARKGFINYGKNLIYREIYPQQELGRLIQSSGLANGVIPITALATVQEVMWAQMHYFPQWPEFLRGDTSAIPEKLAELRAHILDRRAAAENNPKLIAVGDALLASCDSYFNWGKEYVAKQTALIKDSEKTPGGFQRYDEVAERLFFILDLTREDRLIQNFGKQQSTADEIMRQNADTNRLMAENQRTMQEFMREVLTRSEGERAPYSPDLRQMGTDEPTPAPEQPAVVNESVRPNETELTLPSETEEEAKIRHAIEESEIPTELIIDASPGVTNVESAEGTDAEKLDSMEAMENLDEGGK